MTDVKRMRWLPTALPALLAACALLLVSAGDVRAQGFISPLIGYDFSGDSLCPAIDDCDEKHLNFGIALGAMGNVVGFEQEFAYARDFYGEAPGLSSSVLTAMSSFMLAPNLGPTRPYVLAGIGLIKTHVDLQPSDILTLDNNHFGWNAGGGLMIFFGQHVGIRGEVRYFRTFSDTEVLGISLGDERFGFGRAAGALVFKF